MKGVSKTSLRTKVMLLNISMVFLVLIMIGGLVVRIIISEVQDDMGEKALIIGRVVARSPEVQEAILSDSPSEVLQPLSESWRISTGAAFVIVANMDQIRLSHPILANVGTPLSNLYRDPVLHGKEYVYVGQGSLPPSLRGNVPVFVGGKQIGFISVGFYLDKIYREIFLNLTPLIYVFLIASAFSVGGAMLIARNVKKAIFGFEPYQIATIVKEQVATLEAIREGVVAVDVHGSIRLMNNEAAYILGISPEEAVGKSISTVLPQNRLADVMDSGQSVYDEEQRVGETSILANSVPITVDGSVVGAVVSFRDRTEMNRLAEELTGVHRIVDVLRAQTHEFKNKLHTIAGLIQLERYMEAINFAVDSRFGKQELADRLSGRIKDSILYGLLLGKASHMRELGIAFDISPDTRLSRLPDKLTSGDAVLIIGNLLQNAIEAVAEVEDKQIEIAVIEEADELIIRVSNSGPWISNEVAGQIYRRGITTKKSNSGLGLALIAEKLELVSGAIRHRNLPDGGVEFEVHIPY
ncbi:MAG TPA: sensor histidine kinase [Selenomonadales bacterium]|nr:sensor histidine kinase [Selenomonadales bacterium]